MASIDAAGILGLGISKERLRFWGIRSGLAIVDQGFTSGASFLLNLFLARWLLAAHYGAFAVVFATLVFLSGYHNVLLLEPMTVLGPARYLHQLPAYFHVQLKLSTALAICLSLVVISTAGAMAAFGISGLLTRTVAACGVALPPLLLFWLVRRMCYVVQRPALAAWSSAIYFVLLTAGTLIVYEEKWLGSATAFAVIAGASMLALILPVMRLGIFKSRELAHCDWRKVWRENWAYGRWLVASTTLFSVVNQSQMFIVAALLGLGAAGVLRAVQVPSLVMIQVITAVGLLVLPTFSFDFGRGELQSLYRKAKLVSIALGFFTLLFAVLTSLSAGRLERLLYGGKFAQFAYLMPILVLMTTATGIGQGYGMALRAVQKPQFDMVSNAIAAPLAIVSAVVFTRWWGLTGAAVSIVIAFAAQSLVTVLYFRSVSRAIVQPLLFPGASSTAKS